MEMGSMEDLSEYTSCLLDELGFGKKRILERIYTMNKCSRAKDISTKRILDRNDIEKIFVGSQREGIGYEYFNDIDVLQIDHGVICQKSFRKLPEDGRVVFQMERENVPPGYCFLKLLHKDVQSASFARVEYAVQSRKNQKYLSSEVFMTKNDDVFAQGNGYISRHTHYNPRKGPSIPKFVEQDFLTKFVLSQYNLGRSDMDFVRAFPCTTNYMLQEWKNRERSSGWPSNDTIGHVMNLPVYVVPAGQKGSKNIDLQWRICFIMGEIHLVQTFNNVQTKVFVLMKLIAKHVLHPLSEDITSYVVKNVMLWLAEKIAQEYFCDRQLLQRLQDALKYLKRSIQNAYLPCYMLPEKNLFAGKLKKEDQCLVIEKLDYILENGTELVSMCIYTSRDAPEAFVKVYTSLWDTNILDKVHTCLIALYTSEELAEYFVKMYLTKSQWSIIFYNIICHPVPYLCTYGFSEVMSIDLEGQLAVEETKELEMKTNPNPDLQTYKEEMNNNRVTSTLILVLYITCILLDSGGFLVNTFPELVMCLSIFGIKTTTAYGIFIVLRLLTEYKKTSSRMTFLQIYKNNFKVKYYIPKTLHYCDVIIYILILYLQVIIAFNAMITLKDCTFVLFTMQFSPASKFREEKSGGKSAFHIHI